MNDWALSEASLQPPATSKGLRPGAVVAATIIGASTGIVVAGASLPRRLRLEDGAISGMIGGIGGIITAITVNAMSQAGT